MSVSSTEKTPLMLPTREPTSTRAGAPLLASDVYSVQASDSVQAEAPDPPSCSAFLMNHTANMKENEWSMKEM